MEMSSNTQIICDGDLEGIRSLLESLNSGITIAGNVVELSGEALSLRRDVLRLLLSAGHDVLRIEKPEASLNSIYAKMIRKRLDVSPPLSHISFIA